MKKNSKTFIALIIALTCCMTAFAVFWFCRLFFFFGFFNPIIFIGCAPILLLKNFVDNKKYKIELIWLLLSLVLVINISIMMFVMFGE